MLLKLVHDAAQVDRLYAEFCARLADSTIFSESRVDLVLGHQGGGFAAEAAYAPALRIWASPGNLHWNAFGVENSSSMVVQINFPDYANKPRRAGSAFVIDDTGNPVVVHRGHIGGGRRGISRQLMFQECRAEQITLVEADGQKTRCFVVGQLNSPLFTKQLADFVWEVQRVKAMGATPVVSGLPATLLQLEEETFTREKTGSFSRAATEEINLTHGLVVNALATQLLPEAARRGWTVGNDMHRDLWLAAVPELQILFEVKTTVTTQSICTALGQLLLYSASAPKAVLVMVLPVKLPTDLLKILERWNVQVLYYQWSGTTPRFQRLAALVASIK